MHQYEKILKRIERCELVVSTDMTESGEAISSLINAAQSLTSAGGYDDAEKVLDIADDWCKYTIQYFIDEGLNRQEELYDIGE